MYAIMRLFGLLVLSLLPVVLAYPGYPAAHSNSRTVKRQSSLPVDVSGAHRVIAPSGSDLRGPCPGLDAAANHGYIPRNGYATIQQAADGLYQAFGMGKAFGAIILPDEFRGKHQGTTWEPFLPS